LRTTYTQCKEKLKIIMNTVLDPNVAIQYEAFLLLSLFILVGHPPASITLPLLQKNKQMLYDFIGNF
jgi:hypothetical protein